MLFRSALPLVVVICTNFLLSLVILPRMDFSFLAKEVWGGTTIGAVAGVWSVVIALAAATLTVIIFNYRRFPALRESLDAGAASSVMPILMIASLVGFGAVIAALPAFADVRATVAPQWGQSVWRSFTLPPHCQHRSLGIRCGSATYESGCTRAGPGRDR